MKHIATELFKKNVRLKLENRKLRSLLDDIFRAADYDTKFLWNGSSFEIIDRKVADFCNTVDFIKMRRKELAREVARLELINEDLVME
jgi:regulator of replication initiation timing